MSEKPIHQILKGLSILALVYYTASSLTYLFESDSEAQYHSYETVTTATIAQEHLEARKLGKGNGE